MERKKQKGKKIKEKNMAVFSPGNKNERIFFDV